MELLNALQWRYATKRMTGEALEPALVEHILEAARLAPTSSGVQPFHIISISNPALKQAIEPIAMQQPQITECSHLLVFVAWDKMDEARIDARDAYGRAVRNQPPQVTAASLRNLKNLFASLTEEAQHHHAAKQAHIGMGLAIAAAALLRVDATPMEGFDKAALDELLQLRERGLRSVTLLALGRRAEDKDWLLSLEKVRIPMQEFVIEMK